MREHNETYHDRRHSYQSQQCEYSVHKGEDLRNHIENAHKKTIYQECDGSFSNTDELNIHLDKNFEESGAELRSDDSSILKSFEYMSDEDEIPSPLEMTFFNPSLKKSSNFACQPCNQHF